MDTRIMSDIVNNNNSTNNQQQQSNNNYHYEDALDDVHTRFILNLPDSELTTSDRIFFQLEQAWWYYEDWICDVHPEYNLPRYPTFKLFAKMMFEYSPLLPNSTKEFTSMWTEYSIYRRSISNYGCILLSNDYQSMILCQVYNSKTLTYPSGKINHGEDGPTAAARETYEETGFDPFCQRGLTAQWKEENPTNITWNTTFYESDMLVHHEDSTSTMATASSGSQAQSGKRRIVYVVVGVPKDFPFGPVCRKEISDIIWYPVYGPIPKPSYGVIPFLQPLKKYIQKHKNSNNGGGATTNKARDKSIGSSSKQRYDSSTHSTTNNNNNNNNNASNSKNATPKKVRSRNNSRGRNSSSSNPRGNNNNNKEGYENLVQSGLTNYGEDTRWSVEDMFKVNEKLLLTDTKSNYDGNPYIFAEQGFVNGIDPHAFRIVGGAFLNQQQQNQQDKNNEDDNSKQQQQQQSNNDTGGIFHIDPSNKFKQPRSVSRLQALFNSNSNNKLDTNNNNNTDSDGLPDKTSTSHRDSFNNDDVDDDNIDDDDDGRALKPFFSTDGTTPWGEVVEGIKETTTTTNNNNKKSKQEKQRNNNNNKSSSVGRSKQKQQQQQQSSQNQQQQQQRSTSTTANQNQSREFNPIPPLSPPLPPAIITTSTASNSNTNNNNNNNNRKWKEEIIQKYRIEREKQVQQYEQDINYIEQWVLNLPKPVPSNLLYDDYIRFDPDKVLQMAEQNIIDQNTYTINNNNNNATTLPSTM